MNLLTLEEIKAAAALAARHAEERAILAGRQENERRELVAKQQAELQASQAPEARLPLTTNGRPHAKRK